MKQYATLEDTVFFWFGSNDTSGSGNDGASAVYDVRLAGGAAGDAPILSGNATLLTHVNYPAGAYEIAIAATTVNGFAASNTYAIFCTLLVDSQNPTGFIGSFDLKPVEANAKQWLGTACATPTVNGVPEVDITHLGGVAQSATDLKDLADTGYDPATHKVAGVVLADTCTTNTDLVTAAVIKTAIEAAGGHLALILEDTGTTLPATLTTIDGIVDAILLDTGTDGVLLTATAVDAILDEAVEGTLTMRQLLRIALSGLAGKSTGGGTATLTFRDNADAKARITATVDATGNRTAITLDGT